MRRGFSHLVPCVSALLLLIGCGVGPVGGARGGGGGRLVPAPAIRATAPASTVTVEMKGTPTSQYFSPATVSVPVGTTVVWVNHDDTYVNHTVTSDTGLWDSGTLYWSDTYSHRFDQPGTYRYHSTTDTGMNGTVVVQ